MKRLQPLTAFLFMCLALLVLACDSNNQAQTETAETEIPSEPVTTEISEPSLLGVLQNQQNLSTFLNLALSARWNQTLEAIGPYTLFVPSDEAFNQLPADQLENIRNLPVEELQDILSHHMIDRRMLEDELEGGGTLDMLSGRQLQLSNQSGTMRVGDARVVSQLEASNGTIYVIDKVLMPANQ